MRYVVPRLLAALLLAGAGLSFPWGPVAGQADAAVCSSDSGVTVVVDFHELGGGVQTVCDSNGGGKYADYLFENNGFPLTYVNGSGFVCRVSGKPADDPCTRTPPEDAYWGLFWSNGTSGQWSYASSGVGTLRIPDGGSVAFSWQGSNSRTYPGVAPPQHPSSQPSSSPSTQPSPSPSSKPSGGGGATGGGGGGSGTTTAPTTDTATASPTGAAPGHHHDRKGPGDQRAAHRKHRESEHARTPSPSAATSSAQPRAEGSAPASGVAAPENSGGMPGWIPLAAIGLLFATAVGVGVVQRRRS